MKLVTLGEMFKITSGGTPSRDIPDYYNNGSIPWVKTGDLKQKYIEESSEYITELAVKKSSAKLFPKGTVLIAMYGATIGATSILNIDATTNQACAALLPNDKMLPEYLFYFFIANKKNIVNMGVGGAQPNISGTILKGIKISLENLDRQREIVNTLDKAQSLIDKRKAQLEDLDELVKSRFIGMFGDPAKNIKEWDVVEIGKYLNVLTDYHSNGSYESLRDNVTLLDNPDYALMVRTTDLENNNFQNDVKYIDEHAYNHLEKSKVFGGEIIINKIGSAGKIYLMPFLNRPVSLAMNQFLLRFEEKKVNHIFLYNLLATSYMESKIKKNVRGAVTKTITKDAIREIKIMVPPIKIQKEFVEFVNQVDKLKFEMQQSLTQLENNFNVIMQRAFKGELFD